MTVSERASKIALRLVGVGCLATSGYIAVTHSGSWGMWDYATVATFMGVGLVLVGQATRVLSRVAPYFTFIETPNGQSK